MPPVVSALIWPALGQLLKLAGVQVIRIARIQEPSSCNACPQNIDEKKIQSGRKIFWPKSAGTIVLAGAFARKPAPQVSDDHFPSLGLEHGSWRRTSGKGNCPDFEKLLFEARRGSSYALGQLLESFRPVLLRTVHPCLGRRLQSKTSADDLVQESYVKAVKCFGQFKGETERQLCAWLCRIAEHCLADFYKSYQTNKRALGRERRLDNFSLLVAKSNEPDMSEPAIHEGFVKSELARGLFGAINRIPAEYFQVLALKIEVGLTFPEIARRFHNTSEGARKLYHRALERFGREMKEAGIHGGHFSDLA